MKRTDAIIICSLMCVIGIYIGRNYDIALYLLCLGTFIALMSIRRRRLIVLALALMLCALGNARGVAQNSGFDLLRGIFETKATIIGRSLDDAEYNSRGQLAFSISEVEIDGEKIPGQVAVSGFGEFSVLRGDLVEVTGKVFPARGSNQARVSFAQLDVLESDNQWYNALRRKLNKQLRDNLPEPQSSFAAGLLIGQRTTIPDSILTSLRITGLAHIIAVSGYNLTIIVRGVMRIMKQFSRYQRLISSFVVITVFLLITGFSASIVRASIVCGLSLFAWYYGRTFRPAVLLSIVALATTFYKPEYVWGDAGWYLSFLAFTGIMIISPIIRNRIYGEKEPKLLGKLLIETISVLLMVTPYSVYLFGSMSLIALPSNILVVPVIPLAMSFSALAIIVPHWFAVLAIPANLVLSLVLEMARILSTVPRASLSIRTSLYETLIAYGLIALVAFLVWNRSRKRLEGNILVQYSEGYRY